MSEDILALITEQDLNNKQTDLQRARLFIGLPMREPTVHTSTKRNSHSSETKAGTKFSGQAELLSKTSRLETLGPSPIFQSSPRNLDQVKQRTGP